MKNLFRIPAIALLMTAVGLCFSCKKDDTAPPPPAFTDPYSINGTKIYNYDKPVQFIGANAFHIFGAGGSDMNAWKIDLAREFIGNIKETPLSGYPLKDANGSYLHSMQTVADSNRLSHRITLFGAFGWDGTNLTEFTGKRPSQTAWWNDYKARLAQWAAQFKNQPDVWLEVWNEPYRYDRTDGYTDDIWASDMTELVNIIRTAGNNNVVLVPCAEQGQDESVLLHKGTAFLEGKKNILFDIHAYEKWLLVSNTDLGNRLQALKTQGLPVLFGEVGPLNAGVLMNPKAFTDSLYNRGLSVCAWVWKYDSNDKDALLGNDKLPNNQGNNNWGSLYQSLCLRPRKP